MNDYLTLGWLRFATDAAMIGACAAVIFICICRVNMLNWRTYKISWSAVYATMSVFAGGVAADIANLDQPRWYVVAGLLGLLLHLSTSWRLWRIKPPEYTRKGYKR